MPNTGMEGDADKRNYELRADIRQKQLSLRKTRIFAYLLYNIIIT
jgi:hypothetical protein